MRWIKRLFTPYIVAVSEPFLDGQRWSYIFGDENKFKLRTFQNSEIAFDSYKITLSGLSSGSPEIPIKLIRLDAEQAHAVQDEVAYRALIEPFL